MKTNENSGIYSNGNILLTPSYVEKFEKCNEIIKNLEIKCI